jgi:hypothetical protein
MSLTYKLRFSHYIVETITCIQRFIVIYILIYLFVINYWFNFTEKNEIKLRKGRTERYSRRAGCSWCSEGVA